MAATWVTVVVFLYFSSYSLASKEEFHEELLIKPLPTGHVYTYFQFTTLWDVDMKNHEACKCSTNEMVFDLFWLSAHLNHLNQPD
jgi:hypothetical protein